MIVYRFQNTKEIETRSYCEDIVNIWLGYRGEESEEVEITDELIEEIEEEWGRFIDLRLSTEEYGHLTGREWIEKILSFETEEEIHTFQMSTKLDGVFAIEPTETLEEAFRCSMKHEMGLHNRYLIIGEAEVVEEFGSPFGMLVQFETILDVIEVPAHYRK